MEKFLADLGLVAIVLTVLYIIKKVNFLIGSRPIHIQDQRVYQAARQFVQGVSHNEIKEFLSNCIQFDEDDIDDILSSIEPDRLDGDGGYGAFLKAANKVLGVEVYCIVCSK